MNNVLTGTTSNVFHFEGKDGNLKRCIELVLITAQNRYVMDNSTGDVHKERVAKDSRILITEPEIDNIIAVLNDLKKKPSEKSRNTNYRERGNIPQPEMPIAGGRL